MKDSDKIKKRFKDMGFDMSKISISIVGEEA